MANTTSIRIALVSVLFLGLSSAPAQSAYTVTPKVRQCFLHTSKDVSAAYARKNPISCSKTHNTETYLVTSWPGVIPPSEMGDEEALDIADVLCNAWDEGGLLDGSAFNYWAWFTPDPAGWAKGQRWLRCDAMIIIPKSQPRKFASWRGLKFNNSQTY